MMKLSPRWTEELMATGETGMGYQVATVVLKDGTRFDQAVIVEGCITQIKGHDNIPFSENDILAIAVTHDKWDFNHKK
jgi:hypothetical protein